MENSQLYIAVFWIERLWTARPPKKWNALLLNTIAKLGEERFFQTLSAEFQEIVHLDKSNLIIAYTPESTPIIMVHSLKGGDVKLHIDQYLAGLYILDPFYRASMAGLASGFYTLDEVAPDNFRETEFFLRYYRNAGITNDMGYCFNVGVAGGENDYIHFSFACCRGEKLAPKLIDNLREMEPFVHALVVKHLRLTGNRELTPASSDLHRQLQLVMNDFGSSILTNRERQVLLLILHGHSSRSIAEKLDIAQFIY